jgi:serine/threonine protein kinase
MNTPFERAEPIFEAALQLPPERRAAYLDQACGVDAGLRQQVEALLQAHEQAEHFMADTTAPPPPGPTVQISIPLTEKLGDKIGHYKLLQEIGEGGCGVVYMAEQTEPIRRRVAFKVIKLGMDTKSVVARFEAERQALALMDHPNIAKVLDAGATETGRPYFVMELVKGIKITEFCDQNHLATKERLDLFIQVCHAIQHAHQKGIIHRDIKPSNVLVTLHDGVPVPKVIDFGIAKATQQPLTDKTVFTAFGQFIGTPAYMSPEQAELSGLDIDTRTDIYSLGVLLYELLVGKPPFDPETLLKAGLDEMRRIIRETEPPKPSTKLATAQAATRHSAFRTPQLKEVRGDLDWIVMKCLEKDRIRRYGTANDLAADIGRHLESEPILARPPSTAYQVGKFVRRHKARVAVGLVVVLAIAAGVMGQSVNLVRARRAEQEQRRLLEVSERAQAEAEIGRFRAQLKEQRAQLKATQADDAAGFLRMMFLSGTTGESDTNFLNRFFDWSSKGLPSLAKDQPGVTAGLYSGLALSYSLIGQPAKAEASYREAVRLSRKAETNNESLLARRLLDLANQLERQQSTGPRSQERQSEADQLTREVIALLSQVQAVSSDTRSALSELEYVAIARGMYDPEGEVQLRREIVNLMRRLPDEDRRGLVQALARLRQSLERGHLDEALAVAREEVEVTTKAWGRTNAIARHAKADLARLLARRGESAQAEAVYREVIADSRAGGGSMPIDAARSYASFLTVAGRNSEAERILLDTWDYLQKRTQVTREDRETLAEALANLYRVWDTLEPRKGYAALAAQWEQKQSESAHLEPTPWLDWSEFRRLSSDPDKRADWLQKHPELVSQSPVEAAKWFENLARTYAGRQRPDRAAAMQREALRVFRGAVTNSPSGLAVRILELALVLADQGQSNEVDQLAHEAINLIGKEPSLLPDTSKALMRLQMLAEKTAATDPERTLQLYRQGAELTRRIPPLAGSGLLVDFVTGARVQLVKLGRWREAEPAAREALELTTRVYGDTNSLGARMELASVLEHRNKLAEAEALYREAAAGLLAPLANDERGAFNRFISGQGRYAPLDNDPFGRLSRFLVARGRRAEAEQVLLDGWSKFQAYPRTTAQQTREAATRVVEFYEAWNAAAPNAGKATKATLWKQKLAAFDRVLAETDP